MSDYMPIEVMVEILSWLPVKSLIRFRCVSKTWFTLITTHDFISKHLNRALSNPQHPPHLLFRHFDENMKKETFTLHSSHDPLPRNHFSKHLSDTDRNLDRPSRRILKKKMKQRGFFAFPLDFIELHCPHKCFMNESELFFIVGSSNGLVCIVDDAPGKDYDIVPILWNPSIRKAIVLPSSGVKFPLSYLPMECLGFGYEPITDDYKLVRIVYLQDCPCHGSLETHPPLIQTYSLRTGVWSTIPYSGSRFNIVEQSLSVFVNGSVHWLAEIRDDEDDDDDDSICSVIFSFDIGNEVFHEMAVPKCFERGLDLNMSVAVIGGLLALVPCNSKVWTSDPCYSVWVMKEYGVAESWTKLFDIDVGVRLGRVLGFKKNGEVIMVTNAGKLLCYEPRSRTTSDPHIRSRTESFYLDTFMESLVLLNVKDGDLGRQANSSTASKGKGEYEEKGKIRFWSV